MNALIAHLGEDGILRVSGKGAKEREVVLAARTVMAIQDFHALRTDISPFLFVTEDGTQLTYHGVKKPLPAVAQCGSDSVPGSPPVSPHAATHFGHHATNGGHE